MSNFFERFAGTMGGVKWTDLLDIFLVAFLIYNIFMLIKETRAIQMLQGLVIILFFFFLSNLLNLYAVSWILEGLTTIWIIAFIIVFQPELRRAIVELGQNRDRKSVV